ncbi:hypothetical protein KM043_004620 [Ampulex compressa]|nr:hypothetical protein KM043_004620 [Ampulex compressa]
MQGELSATEAASTLRPRWPRITLSMIADFWSKKSPETPTCLPIISLESYFPRNRFYLEAEIPFQEEIRFPRSFQGYRVHERGATTEKRTNSSD